MIKLLQQSWYACFFWSFFKPRRTRTCYKSHCYPSLWHLWLSVAIAKKTLYCEISLMTKHANIIKSKKLHQKLKVA